MCDKDLFESIQNTWWITSVKAGGRGGQKKNDKPVLYLLAALVHRNNPDIIPDATDAASGATCEDIRKKTKETRAIEVAAAKVAPYTVKGELEELTLKNKNALMEKTNELQEISGVQSQLLMMEKFKSSFVNRYNRNDGDGDAEYDETICDILDEFPIMKKRKARAMANNRGDN